VYLGVSFKAGGYISTYDLITTNAKKSLLTFDQLSTIGISPKDFSKLLATRFYAQII
jgi:hypothetical protein